MKRILIAVLLLMCLGGCVANTQKKVAPPAQKKELYRTIALKKLLATGHPVRLSVFAIPPYLKGMEIALQQEYVNQGANGLSVIDRHDIDRIIQEQELQLSGMVAEETAIEAGRLAGVTHLLLLDEQITRTSIGEKKDRWEKLLDVETGRILSIDTTLFLTLPGGRVIMLRNDVAQ